MRRFKKLAIAIGIVLIVIIALFGMMFVAHWVLYGEGVYSRNSYPNYNAAAAANAIGGDSVIPSFLPPSAIKIRYVTYFDLDISRLWLFFIFDTAEISEIRKSCKRVTEGKVRYWGGRPPGDFIRWPDELAGKARIRGFPDYEFYWCELGTREQSLLGINTGVLTVDIKKGKAYYSEEADFLED
jgi:hypothetical protein